jgi:CyaY protein
MDEREYQQLADAALAEIEARLDSTDIDYEIAAGGILQIDLDDGSQIVINKQSAAREIWVAARSGGFHYRWNGTAWLDTRGGEELHTALARLTRA